MTWIEWVLLIIYCYAWAVLAAFILAHGIEKGWIPEKPDNDCDP